MSRKTLRPAGVAVAVLVSLVLTGCGSADDKPTAEAAPAASATASASAGAGSAKPKAPTKAATPSGSAGKPGASHVPGTGDENPGDHSNIGGGTAATKFGGRTTMGALETFTGIAVHDKFVFSEAASANTDIQVHVAQGAMATTSNPSITKKAPETMTLAELGKRLAAVPAEQRNIVWAVTFTADGDIKSVKDS
ncbi:hypothetical protein [Streptomyces sp. NPDC090445]|uniref:hypothetical protein n=1 Tax=Streptomyces sp. NPDC090445 TaxID=3365963 RepID=UPI00380E1EBD